MRYEKIGNGGPIGRDYDVVDHGNKDRSDHVMCTGSFEDTRTIVAALELAHELSSPVIHYNKMDSCRKK